MNGVMKGMILVLMILYIVSPIDACPGPIDDLIVLFIGLAARKQIGSRESGGRQNPGRDSRSGRRPEKLKRQHVR